MNYLNKLHSRAWASYPDNVGIARRMVFQMALEYFPFDYPYHPDLEFMNIPIEPINKATDWFLQKNIFSIKDKTIYINGNYSDWVADDSSFNKEQFIERINFDKSEETKETVTLFVESNFDRERISYGILNSFFESYEPEKIKDAFKSTLSTEINKGEKIKYPCHYVRKILEARTKKEGVVLDSPKEERSITDTQDRSKVKAAYDTVRGGSTRSDKSEQFGASDTWDDPIPF